MATASHGIVVNPASLSHLCISIGRPLEPEILQIRPIPAGLAQAGPLQIDENSTKFDEILKGAPCKIGENYSTMKS